jgi:capsular polysaccharide export protein
MNVILVLIESQQQFAFFSRCKNGFDNLSYQMEFVTNLLSVYLQCSLKKIPCSLTRFPIEIKKNKDFSQCGELLYGYFTQNQANVYYSSFAERINKILLMKSAALSLMWGGGDTVASLAMIDVCRLRSIPILYVDRANIPGKIFVDPKGMNFNSELYQNISLLDMVNPDTIMYERYRKEFITTYGRSGSGVRKKINWFLPIDILYSRFRRLPFRGATNLCKKFSEIIFKKDSLIYDDYILAEGKYIFVPLNHSFEIRKERKDYLPAEEIIKNACSLAKEQQKDVVVKFHPAENDRSFISFINSIKTKYHFIIRHEDSRTLLVNAYRVVASNTSVALEAMLLKRPIVHFAKSLYKELDEKRLINFVTSFLIDVDIYSNDQIPDEIVAKFLKRAHVI